MKMCFNHIFFNINTDLSETTQWRTHSNGFSDKKRFQNVKFVFRPKRLQLQTALAQANLTVHLHLQAKRLKYRGS